MASKGKEILYHLGRPPSFITNYFQMLSGSLLSAPSQQALRKAYYPGKRVIYLMSNTSRQFTDASQATGELSFLLQLPLLHFCFLALGDVPDKNNIGAFPLICGIGTGNLNGNLGAIFPDNGHLKKPGDAFATHLSFMSF